MTTRNTYSDFTYTKLSVPFNNPYTFGLYVDRNTIGTDRSAAEKAAGLYPDHVYSGTRREIFYGDHKSQELGGGAGGSTLIRISAGPGVESRPAWVWDSNDEIALLGKLAEKYRGAEWNAGIFVGELGKTVDSIAVRTRQLAKVLLAVKRGNVNTALSILKAKPSRELRANAKLGVQTIEATSLWLEIRYAWRPLLKDIYDLSQSIQKLDVPRQKIIRVQRKIPKIASSAMPTVYAAEGEGFYIKAIKATVKEKPFSYPEYLGLTNPESVIWELIPLSFVVDWFIPIGNYLETRNVISRISDGAYVRTTFDWHRVRVSGLSKAYVAEIAITKPAFTHIGLTSPNYRNEMTINRTLETSLSVPTPVFRNPIGNNPASRALDAISLVYQIGKSFLK